MPMFGSESRKSHPDSTQNWTNMRVASLSPPVRLKSFFRNGFADFSQ